MEHWESALKSACLHGYWADVEGCGRIAEEFHKFIKHKLAGDALQKWEQLEEADAEYRLLAETEARLIAPVPDDAVWWKVLEVSPDTAPELIRANYIKKMKQCHPDRVAGLAQEIVEMAETMAKRLTDALDASRRK